MVPCLVNCFGFLEAICEERRGGGWGGGGGLALLWPWCYLRIGRVGSVWYLGEEFLAPKTSVYFLLFIYLALFILVFVLFYFCIIKKNTHTHHKNMQKKPRKNEKTVFFIFFVFFLHIQLYTVQKEKKKKKRYCSTAV